jgi:hypothetical protein
MRKFLVILFSLVVMGMCAQELKWDIDFNTVFNNREGGDEATPDQTIFFTRLAPEVGLSMMNGTHSIMGGVSWYQPVNDACDQYKVIPTIYYRYNSPEWRFTFGMLPRTLLMERMPHYMWSDSLSYLQPNIHGALIQYVRQQGYAEFMLDWRQMQTTKRREAFDVTFSGKWRPVTDGAFYLGGHLRYNHLAKRKGSPADENVNDHITVNPLIGVDLSHRTSLDSLRLEGGLLMQCDRNRIDAGTWHTPCGFVADAVAQWHWLGVEENFFAGKKQMPLYTQYASEMYLGDQYYNSKLYSRTDVYAEVLNNRFMDLRASLIFHATDKTTGFWQQISLRVYIDNYIWKKRHDNAYLKGERLKNTY